MPNALLTATLDATLLAFDNFNDSLDSTGCDEALAVADQRDLSTLIDLATSFCELLSQKGASGDAYHLLIGFMARIHLLDQTADDTGCEAPYTVVCTPSWPTTLTQRHQAMDWLKQTI